MRYIYIRYGKTITFSPNRRADFVEGLYTDLNSIYRNIDMADVDWMVDMACRCYLTHCMIFGTSIHFEHTHDNLKVEIHDILLDYKIPQSGRNSMVDKDSQGGKPI